MLDLDQANMALKQEENAGCELTQRLAWFQP